MKKKASTLADRVNEGLRKVGSNPHAASLAIGRSKSYVGKIIAGDIKKISFSTGIKLAKYLHMCPEYLQNGKNKSRISIIKGAEQRDISDNPKLPLIMRHIPILTWEEVSNLNIRSINDIPERADRDYIGDLSNTGLSNFALIMEGKSMIDPQGRLESFREGEILYFDPTIAPYIGCYVLARDKEKKEAYFRYLGLDCGVPYLIPHGNFPVIKMTSNIEIIGVLVDAHRRFKHNLDKISKRKIKYLADFLKNED